MKAMPGTVPTLTSFCLAWVGQHAQQFSLNSPSAHRPSRAKGLPASHGASRLRLVNRKPGSNARSQILSQTARVPEKVDRSDRHG
jgi:hypothetical protein